MKTLIIPAQVPSEYQTSTRTVGVAFPLDNILVKDGKGTHVASYATYFQRLNERLAQQGAGNLSEKDINAIYQEFSAPLIWGEKEKVMIRPPNEMKDARIVLKTDEMLQDIGIPAYKIRFLDAANPKIRKALMMRGECYRFAALPKTKEEMKKFLAESKKDFGSGKMYYCNEETGTKWISFEDFERLRGIEPDKRAKCLAEMAKFLETRNGQNYIEADFFMADRDKLEGDFIENKSSFLKKIKECAEKGAPAEDYEGLVERLKSATPRVFRKNTFADRDWRTAMLSTLIGKPGKDKERSQEEAFLGLSEEYHMKVRWLPGVRIERGEIMPDKIYEMHEQNPGNEDLETLCNGHKNIVMDIIHNNFREYPNMRSINIGTVVQSLSRLAKRKNMPGRRGVYIVELCLPGKTIPLVKFLRMQKRDISEFLDKKYSFEKAHRMADQYHEYALDRYLACRQLGINLKAVKSGKVHEIYRGTNKKHHGKSIQSTYFERLFVYGTATDKILPSSYKNPEFSGNFAKLLGKAAAANIIVGRVNEKSEVLFDDGDEILQQDGRRMTIVVADPTGSFAGCSQPYETFIPAYAEPVIQRARYLKNIEEFITNYVNTFVETFKATQKKYRAKKRGFNNLFSSRQDSGIKEMNISDSWSRTLHKLDNADPKNLGNLLRTEIYNRI